MPSARRFRSKEKIRRHTEEGPRGSARSAKTKVEKPVMLWREGFSRLLVVRKNTGKRQRDLRPPPFKRGEGIVLQNGRIPRSYSEFPSIGSMTRTSIFVIVGVALMTTLAFVIYSLREQRVLLHTAISKCEACKDAPREPSYGSSSHASADPGADPGADSGGSYGALGRHSVSKSRGSGVDPVGISLRDRNPSQGFRECQVSSAQMLQEPFTSGSLGFEGSPSGIDRLNAIVEDEISRIQLESRARSEVLAKRSTVDDFGDFERNTRAKKGSPLT